MTTIHPIPTGTSYTATIFTPGGRSHQHADVGGALDAQSTGIIGQIESDTYEQVGITGTLPVNVTESVGINVTGVTLVEAGGGSVDETTKAFKTIAYDHNEIHNGNHFFCHKVISIGSSAKHIYLLQVPDTGKWPHFFINMEGTNAISMGLYEGCDGTGAVQLSGLNSNRNSLTVPNLEIYAGQSGATTSGNLIDEDSVGEGKKLGGAVRHEDELILKQNTKYLLDIINGAAETTTVSMKISWYEHTNY